MKNSEIIKILENKETLKTLKGKYQFTKAVTLNLKKIEDEVKLINEYIKPSPEHVELLKKRQELFIKYSGGKTIKTETGAKYDIPVEEITNPDSEFNKEGNALVEEYSDVIAASKEQEAKYLETLDSECTIDFILINEKDMPDDISMEQMELLINFIKM